MRCITMKPYDSNVEPYLLESVDRVLARRAEKEGHQWEGTTTYRMKPGIYLQARVAAKAVIVGVLLASSIHNAFASIIFSDDFDLETGLGDGASGQSGINYSAFANWAISDGTVDLLAQGDFAPGAGISCVANVGKCVDLDGSADNAGMMTSVALALDTGRYSLFYELGGVDFGFRQSAAGIPNTVDIFVQSVGGGVTFFTDKQVRNQGDLFARAGGIFEIATPVTVEIVFQDLGGDNFGAVLDNVTLATAAAPTPPTIALLLVGVLALGVITGAAEVGTLAGQRRPWHGR